MSSPVSKPVTPMLPPKNPFLTGSRRTRPGSSCEQRLEHRRAQLPRHDHVPTVGVHDRRVLAGVGGSAPVAGGAR